MRSLLSAALFCTLGLATAAHSADKGVIQRRTTGCIDKSPMARANVLDEQDDPIAARVLVTRGLQSGMCRPFAPGEAVIVEDGDILAGLSRVHTLGDPTAFWVPEKAVRTIY